MWQVIGKTVGLLLPQLIAAAKSLASSGEKKRKRELAAFVGELLVLLTKIKITAKHISEQLDECVAISRDATEEYWRKQVKRLIKEIDRQTKQLRQLANALRQVSMKEVIIFTPETYADLHTSFVESKLDYLTNVKRYLDRGIIPVEALVTRKEFAQGSQFRIEGEKGIGLLVPTSKKWSKKERTELKDYFTKARKKVSAERLDKIVGSFGKEIGKYFTKEELAHGVRSYNY
jgi:hypothetical protein